MLKYNNYVFEKKLEVFLHSINEGMTRDPKNPNVVYWDGEGSKSNVFEWDINDKPSVPDPEPVIFQWHIKDVKIKNKKVIWDNIAKELEPLPKHAKKLLKMMLSKTKKFIAENVTDRETFDRVATSVISKIFTVFPNVPVRKKVLYITIIFLLTFTAYNTINLLPSSETIKNEVSSIISDAEETIKKSATEIIDDAGEKIRDASDVIKNIDPKKIVGPIITPDDTPDSDISDIEIKGELKDYLKVIAKRESSGNWKAINQYGYIGLYQFGKQALKDVGYSHINTRNFRKDPSIFPIKDQNIAMVKLLKKNKHYLRNFLKYEGKTIGGIKITRSGLLAAAHLIGNSKVKKFLRTNGRKDAADKNGTKCSEYLKKFGGYNIGI